MRRILITGFATDSRKQSPIFNKRRRRQFEVWSFNNDMEQFAYAVRHFEMHELEVYGEKAVDDASPAPRYIQRLHEGLGMPVYMLRAADDIPGSVAYPIDEVVAMFGDYLTNSISYMLAIAILERVDEIHLYGIDMAREHEHGWERPSIEFYLGWAKALGIKVVVPDTSDLLKCLGLYGYVNTYEEEAMLRERRDQLTASANEYERAGAIHRGAIQELDYWITRTILPGDRQMAASSKKARSRKALLTRRAEQLETAEKTLRTAAEAREQ